KIPCGLGDTGGICFVRIELDGDPAIVIDRMQRREYRRKIDGAFAGSKVLMYTILPDVLQMQVNDVVRYRADDRRGILPDAEQVADVAVHSDQRFVAEITLFELAILAG